MVKGYIIHNHDIARLQTRCEKVFDKHVKNLTIDRPFNRHGRFDATLAHGTDHGKLSLDLERFGDNRTFAFGGAGV